ncbi:MAG: hypothetical protein ACFBRM_10145 [Pikeienuella sp.]
MRNETVKLDGATTSAKRGVMRVATLGCLGLASLFIAVEWAGLDLGLQEGALTSAGLVLCLSANMMSVLLLIARRRG